jgi:Leucine-rich repeat (LRR) protein
MDLICLEELDLSGNFIAAFSSNLLPSLKRVNLTNNQLESAEVINFLKLRYVHLSYNKLKAFPKCSERNHIKVLSLEHNTIDAIPSTVTDFHSLNMLNLSHNAISFLPKDLQKIEGLKEKGLDLSTLIIYLGHNPIQKIECWDFLMRKGTKSTIETLEKTLPVGDAPKLLLKKKSSCSSDPSETVLRESA